MPENLFFQGGGTKVLAYIGAMQQLKAIFGEDYFSKSRLTGSTLKRVGGTSGGAITAMMVALNIDLQALCFLEDVEGIIGRDISLSDTKIEKAFDGAIIFFDKLAEARRNDLLERATTGTNGIDTLIPNTLRGMIRQDGLFSTEKLRQRIGEQIKKKLESIKPQLEQLKLAISYDEHLTFGELKAMIEKGCPFKHLHVTVINVDAHQQELQVINSEDSQWANVTIASAVAASCAIPGAFKPAKLYEKTRVGNKIEVKEVQGQSFIDGGVLRNYYPSIFDSVKYTRAGDSSSQNPPYVTSEYNRRTLVLGIKRDLETLQPSSTEVVSSPSSAQSSSTLPALQVLGNATRVLLNDVVEQSGDIGKANSQRTIWLDPVNLGTLDTQSAEKKDFVILKANLTALAFFKPTEAIQAIDQALEELSKKSKQIIENWGKTTKNKAKYINPIKTSAVAEGKPYYAFFSKIEPRKKSKTAPEIKKQLEKLNHQAEKLEKLKQDALQLTAQDKEEASLPTLAFG